MKKLLFPSLILFLAISCSDSDDPQPAACQPTTIEYFDEASTYFYFEPGDNGFNLLSEVSVYDGTDSAYQYTYEYTDNQLSGISSNRNGSTINYTATLDGDKLTTLSGRPSGAGIVGEEIRFQYSGNDVSRLDYFVADPNTGELYQYLHYAFTYSEGNLTSISYNVDLEILFTLAFGQTPTAPYSPELIFTNTLEYGSQDAPNPLLGQFNLFRPELSMGNNMPVNLIQRDPEGNLIGSLGYSLSFNEQGFPTLADTGNSFIDITYNCN